MSAAANPLIQLLNRTSLVLQIFIGLVAGIALALLLPQAAASVGLLGNVFVAALKAVAPVLVFVLVAALIANHQHGQQTHIKPILLLYLIGTFSAALIAVAASFTFPSSLTLASTSADLSPPGGIAEVLKTLLMNVVDNPINALLKGNFIGILAWAVALGFALRHASPSTKQMLADLSDGVTSIVKLVIRLAPLGIFGLVAATLAESGMSVLLDYLHLLLVLVGCMLFVALLVNPLIVFVKIRRNPYPLVLTCLRESGLTLRFPLKISLKFSCLSLD
jgi:serine/threonine transporter